MVTRIYKESCADYYPKTPSASECKNQINCLVSPSLLEFRYVDEKKGIKLVGLLEKIWQVIRGFFGFTNYTDPVLIKSETLKLLHYGKFNGFLEDEGVLKSIENFKTAGNNQIRAGKSVSSLVNDICDNSKTLSIADFQEKLVNYHQKHERGLRPGFWQRLFVAPQIDITPHMPFGSSHLQLAKQVEKFSSPHSPEEEDITVIKQKNQARDEALKQYHFALALGNNDLEQRTQVQFKKFLENWWPRGKDTNSWGLVPQEQKKQMLHLVRTLSSSTHQSLHESIKSEEFASFGLSYFSDDLPLRVTKYVAQVKQKKYQEAYNNCISLEGRAEELELSLKCLDSEDRRSKKLYLSELKMIYESY